MYVFVYVAIVCADSYHTVCVSVPVVCMWQLCVCSFVSHWLATQPNPRLTSQNVEDAKVSGDSSTELVFRLIGFELWLDQQVIRC